MWQVVAEAIQDNATTVRFCVVVLVLGLAAFMATLLVHIVWPTVP